MIYINLGHSLRTRRGRAFIFHMCIPCDKTLHTVSLFLSSLFKKFCSELRLESEELNIFAIYTWLPLASYVVFLRTLVLCPGLKGRPGYLVIGWSVFRNSVPLAYKCNTTSSDGDTVTKLGV